MFKKLIAFMLTAVIFLSSSLTYAATSAQPTSTWKDTLAKMELLGIIDQKELNTAGNMSREVFSKIIVNSTDNYDLAQSLSGSTTFSDVSKTSAYCGYINAAINKGYLSALSNGQFKPKDSLNFAQLCTAMVKALGYSGTDIIGTWPIGYIEKAKSLSLTTGYSYKSTDSVSTAATITMIYKMLNTNVKKANTADADVKLIDSVGLKDDGENWKYGDPQIAMNFDPNTKKLGSITFKSGVSVIKNTYDNEASPATSKIGESVTLKAIEDKDVVYEVYNKLNILKYYLVVENKIEGEITSILPNKYSPTSIKINEVEYKLSEDAKIAKFNQTAGSFNVGDDVDIILGYDGKVVDAYYSDYSDNDDFAFVVSTKTEVSSEKADYGKVTHKVSLMHIDGTTKTYDIDENPDTYNWKLVKYEKVTDDKVKIKNIGYKTAEPVKIDKYQDMVDNYYVAGNLKIFNYTDSTVKVIDWEDMPDGRLAANKVKYIGTAGEFNDVNIMLINDLNNEQYRNYIVESYQKPDDYNKYQYVYTLVSGSSRETYTTKDQIFKASAGSILKMKTYNNAMGKFDTLLKPDATGWLVQAVDSKRIKLNDRIYVFSSDIEVYFRDYSGKVTKRAVTDIKTGAATGYKSVDIYCDNSLNEGGKVKQLVISYTR